MIRNIYSRITDQASQYNERVLRTNSAIRNFSSSSTVGLGLVGAVQPLFGSAAGHFGEYKTWRDNLSASDAQTFLSVANNASTTAPSTQLIDGTSFTFDSGGAVAPTGGQTLPFAAIFVRFDSDEPIWIRQGETVSRPFVSYSIYAVAPDYTGNRNFEFWAAYIADASRGLSIHHTINR